MMWFEIDRRTLAASSACIGIAVIYGLYTKQVGDAISLTAFNCTQIELLQQLFGRYGDRCLAL